MPLPGAGGAIVDRAEAPRWSWGDRAFAAFFALYLAFAVCTMVAGLATVAASVIPAFHQALHDFGFGAQGTPERLALAIAAASHRQLSWVGVALDQVFCVFNIGLALFLLRLRPRNPTARLLALGLVGTASIFNLTAYSVFESMQQTLLVSATNFNVQFVATLCYLFALLTFPDGRLVPRWPRVPLTLLYVLVTVLLAVAGYFMQTQQHRASVVIFFGLVAPAAGVLSQLYRQYRSHGETHRQQARLLFWAMTPALVLGVFAAGQALVDQFVPQLQGRSLHELPETAFRVFQPVFTIIPIALVAGIIRYRLWDVDQLISRTLVYGSLAAVVSAVYIAVVIGIGNLVGSSGGNLFLSIVATGIAAAAFTPLRARFQKLANRLVYGQRATPYEVLADLSARLTEAIGTDGLTAHMAKVLAQGTGATGAHVWLRVGTELRRSASWPPAGSDSQVVLALDKGDHQLPPFPGARMAVPVRHQGELLGAISIEKPANEDLNETERRLVLDLASQAGLVLRNQGLTAELLARLDDLQSSRQRIVAAGNEARKRLERNIHDGAQQQLVALMVRISLAERVAAKESPRVAEMLAQLKSDTSDALETLRDLARGIYPPLLASNGLVTALEAHTRKLTLPVEVDAVDVGRYDEETEAAIYFCCLEALQNVVKSAGASKAVVRLRGAGAGIEFTIEDDGHGFDVDSVRRGSGLQNMVDRVEALAGHLVITSAPGQGTRIRGLVPGAAPKR